MDTIVAAYAVALKGGMAGRLPIHWPCWQEIEAWVALVFSRKGRAGVAMPDLDLFGERVQRVAVASDSGRPRVPLRIMIALLYLKHAFNESDEGVVDPTRSLEHRNSDSALMHYSSIWPAS